MRYLLLACFCLSLPTLALAQSSDKILSLLHAIDKQTAVTAQKVTAVEGRVDEMRSDLLAQYIAVEKRVTDLEKFQWRFAGIITLIVVVGGWAVPTLMLRKMKALSL